MGLVVLKNVRYELDIIYYSYVEGQMLSGGHLQATVLQFLSFSEGFSLGASSSKIGLSG